MRRATPEDINRLTEMGARFHADASPEWPWNAAAFGDFMASLMANQFVMVSDKGFMAGAIAPMPLSPDWLVAHEFLWWSEDNSGPKLARAFRQWAKKQGADEIKWSCRSSNERVQRFYARFSQPCEAVYSEAI